MGGANGRAAGRGQGGGEEVRGEAEEEIELSLTPETELFTCGG